MIQYVVVVPEERLWAMGTEIFFWRNFKARGASRNFTPNRSSIYCFHTLL